MYSYGLDVNFVDKYWKLYLKKGCLFFIFGVCVGKDIFKKDVVVLGGDVIIKGV